MAPLPTNGTARLKVQYQNSISPHSAMIRVASVDDVETAGTDFSNIVSALSSNFAFSEVTGVLFAEASSDLFFPIVVTSLDGVTWGSGAADKTSNAVAATFVGRSAEGRRVKWSLFGWKTGLSEYRVTAAEDGNVGDCVATLNGAETAFLAIDNLAGIWKNYIDIKPNDHWVKKGR